MRAWLFLASGDERQFRSNDGYDDVPSSEYRWDSTVPNHSTVNIGDFIIIRNTKHSLGCATIESITSNRTAKNRYQCPNCFKSNISERKRKRPRFYCRSCPHKFDEPHVAKIDVTSYTASYAKTWIDLSGQFSKRDLNQLCFSPNSMHSLRPLDLGRARRLIMNSATPETIRLIDTDIAVAAGGHKVVQVRARIGQTSFRQNLLASFGPICAFTGPAPFEALEAAHLYSYAKICEHVPHGGLLVRRDIHRLFDLGLITVNPRDLTIEVSSRIMPYPEYASLKGKPLKVTVAPAALKWLELHWQEHQHSHF